MGFNDRNPDHIARREALHTGLAGAFYAGLLALLWIRERRLPTPRERLILAGIVLVGVLINETWDLTHGGSWQKTGWDVLTWVLAVLVIGVGVYLFERRRRR